MYYRAAYVQFSNKAICLRGKAELPRALGLIPNVKASQGLVAGHTAESASPICTSICRK